MNYNRKNLFIRGEGLIPRPSWAFIKVLNPILTTKAEPTYLAALRRGMLIILMMCGSMINCFAREILSLEDVRTLALSHSRALSKINLSLQSALLNEKAEVFDYLPALSLEASASANLWGDQSIEDSFDTGVHFRINENVLIWNGGRKSLLSGINNIATEMVRKDALAEYFSVLDSADKAYYSVLESQASLDLANTSLENSALALSIAEIHREGGMINIAELLQAQADYESKKTSHNQAKRDLSLALATLKSITKLSVIPNLEVIDFSIYKTLIEKLTLMSDQDMNSIYEKLWNVLSVNNPNLKRAALTLQRADQNVTLATKDYFPSLSASLSAGIGYGLKNGFTISDGTLSISASIPLDFWVTANNVQNRKIAQQQSILDYEDTENNLLIDVQMGVLDCVTQAASVTSSQKALEYAEKHYESVLELYRLSQNSVSDLSDASALVSANRNQLIRAQFGFLSCLSAIRSLGAFELDEQVIELLSGT